MVYVPNWNDVSITRRLSHGPAVDVLHDVVGALLARRSGEGLPFIGWDDPGEPDRHHSRRGTLMEGELGELESGDVIRRLEQRLSRPQLGDRRLDRVFDVPCLDLACSREYAGSV